MSKRSFWSTGKLTFFRFASVALAVLFVFTIRLVHKDAYKYKTTMQGSAMKETVRKDAVDPPSSFVGVEKQIDLIPTGLSHCISIRLRGRHNQTFSIDEVKSLLVQGTGITQIPNKLRLGLEFVERPEKFVSYCGGWFHLFHFMEFLVIAFAELDQIRSSLSAPAVTDASFFASIDSPTDISVTVPWMYVPHFTTKEICGFGNGMNCLILDMILGTYKDSSAESIAVHGLESNDNITQAVHPAFAGYLERREIFQRHKGLGNGATTAIEGSSYATRMEKHQQLSNEADATLMIDRDRCKLESRPRIRKIWTNYIANFPAKQWHKYIHEAVLDGAVKHTSRWSNIKSAKLTVCYIDRQNTSRHLPETMHTWLTEFLSSQPSKMRFLHLHMEQYSAFEQIHVASMCDVMLGGHGNGMSHLFWMKPGSYVVEFFWNFGFHFDYATAAQLMGHHYLGFMNGEPMDGERLTRLDPGLLRKDDRKIPKDVAKDLDAFKKYFQDGENTLRVFLRDAQNNV